MELIGTLTRYVQTDTGLQRQRRRMTFDPHAYDLAGIDTSDYAVTLFSHRLDQLLHATAHLGGYWFIWYGREVVATSTGFRRPLSTLPPQEHDHESAATHP